jgi:gas vesicle protein
MTDQVQDQDVELDEIEIEEAQTHDPKNAEAQSVAATAKAGDATKKAPARKGDKSNSEPSQLKSAGTKAESVEFNGDFSEDLNALVESEATLSEEFKAKTAVIFEAAVKQKLSEEIDRLETEYQQQLDEEIQTTKSDLVEKVDGYLNYVVEQWMEDNKLAIQTGLRAEIAEGFMDKLKDLFVESYVEVPESKVDLVDELAEANEELEEQVNVATAKSIELAEELEGYKREAVIREASRDLAETQVEKLRSLAENIDFEDEDTFATKVKTIKESYFSKKTTESVIDESIDDDAADSEVEVSPMMEQYLAALRKTSN